MQTIMEKSPGKLDMIVKRVSVPVGLEELMEGLTKEVLLKKPKDLYLFASEYFSRLIILRERSSTRKAYPIRVVQSVTQAKTPLKSTRHLSRQINVRGKESMMQKEEPKRVVAPSKVSTPKEKKASSNESTPRENKRAPSSIRGQQLKPKGKTREKLSVPGRKVDEVVATSDKKAVRHLKKSDTEVRKVRTVEAATSEIDNLTGTAAIKVKKTNLPKNGDNIIDDSPKKSENFGSGDSKMAPNDRKYMSIIGKAVSSFENDSIAVETVEDDAKIKIDSANVSQEENVLKPLGDVDSLKERKDDNLTNDPLCQERKEIEKGLAAGKPEVDKTTLKSSEDTEVVIEVNTPVVGLVLEKAHSLERNEDNTNHEICNHGDSLTKTEHADVSEGTVRGTENVVKAVSNKALESGKVLNTEAAAKIEKTIVTNADEIIENKTIDTIADKRDEESFKEISVNDSIEKDNEGKINNQVEQVFSEVITTEGMGTKVEKQNKIENNADCPDGDIEAFTIPKHDRKLSSKKSTKSSDKEENGSSSEDIRDSTNIEKIRNKVEDVDPAETLLSEVTKSKIKISKNVEDSTNQIKIVNESVDEDDEEIQKRKNSKEPMYKTTENNYSNNQDDKPNEKILEPPKNIKIDHPTTSSNTDEQSSSTDTEDKLVSIEMQQLGSSDDMLIIRISDRPTPDTAVPETTENENSEAKLQFFRKSEELVQKENGKIRQLLDVEHLHKLIGTSATSGRIDTTTKEFLHSFLSNEQHYSSKDQESSRKIPSDAMVRKVVETASLGLKEFEPINLHEKKIISGMVPDAILATSISEATTLVSEKSDGIQLSEKESFVSRGSDGLTVKTSDVTPQSQKVKFENLPTHGRSVVRTASEAANEDLEQLEALEITETEVTTKCASDVLAGTSEATATSLIQLEDSHITGKANASDVKASKSAITISDLVKTDAVESGPATSTSAQHKPLNSTVEVQQANSQAQKGALELVIAGSKISAVESQKLTPLAETSNNTQFTTTTQQPSEATSDAFKQLVIPPVIDSDTSIIKDSEVTHLVSNHVNSSESKHVFTVQSEESQLKPCDVSDVTEQKTSASLNNLSSSVLKSEQPHSSQTLKDASEVEIIASELSTVKIIEKILNVASDISEQPEKHDAHISVPDISTVKNSEVSNSIAKYDQELTVSSLGGQHLESDEGQKITDNTYDVTEQKVSESTVPALNQRTALNSFAASESAHTRALIHSFLLSEQQYSSQSQNGPVDLVTVSTIESEKRKLLTQGETSNKDASETINDIITFKQPSSSANSDATRTEVPKSQENKLINLLDQSTNYPIEDLNQELQSNEARKTCSKISDDIPEKSSELASAASKQEDLPTFKSVKDLLDYDNLYFTKDDYTESSSGTKSLQLIIVDEDRSEENGAAKIKRSTTIEDVEEMASFAEDSVVVQQRGLVGQETLRGFSMESSGDKMETSTSSSSGGSYGVVKSDISTQSVSESRILVEDMTRDGEAIKEINEQLIVGGIVNKEANAGDVVNIFVEADMVTLATANEGDHVKDEEMKIDSSTNIGKDLVIDGKNVVGAIVAQHDNSAVRCSLNGGQVENNVGLETRTIETIIKSNIDTIDKTLEDVIAEDWVKDKAIKETFNDNTESHENLVADVVRNDELTVTSPINGEQVKSNEVFESEVTETVTEANVDIVNKTNEDTDVRHPVKVEAIKEIPRTSIESVESLVAEPIAVQNVDLAVTDSLNYCQIENKGVEFGTTATTSEGNVDAIDKINESIVVKDQVKDETIKNIPSKSIESSERLVADAFTVQNSDLIATSPLNRDQVENKEDFNFRITETVTKVHVDEIGKTLEDMVTVEPMKDEAVKKPFNKTKSVEKLVEDATVVRNDALNVTGPLNGDEVKNNQSFKFGTIETVSETNVYVVDKTYEDVAAKDALKDETIKENSNSNTEANERLAADAAVVQNDCLAFTSAPNCNQVENKKSFETGITKTISKSNVGEVDKTLEGMVTVDPVKDEAVNETINNSTELIEKLITDAVEHRTKEFSEEVISNNGTHKGVEEKYLKELQAFNKENTFVKDPEPKRRPKIGEIEQVASVIEVVKTTPMVTKRETSPKKPRKSRLAFKERSLSHSNVLNRERSKSSSSERGESKVRRTQSVGILKSQEMETKSRIPTTDSKRSAGRRPLVRQLETNSKELAEKLNFKRSSDGESGEGDERDKGNSGDSKLMVKADENVKEVDKEKGGISTGERSITINENHIAREAEGTKDQNPDYDKSVVKIDEVVKEVNDVKAENVKFLEKVDDFHGNNTKGNEINSADVRSSIDVKEIAKSLVENVETLATEALCKRKTDDLMKERLMAKKGSNVSGDAVVEEYGKTTNAAIKIQSAWKGFVTRKILTAQRKETAAVKIQAVVRRFLDQLHLDKMKNRDIDSSTDQFLKDIVADFSNDTSRTGHEKDKQGTLVDESDAAQIKLIKNITVGSINILSDSNDDTTNDSVTTDENIKEGLSLKTATVDSEMKRANNFLEKGKTMKENISRPVPQNNLESVKEKYDETTNAKIDNFVTATDGPAKQNEELSNAETLLNDKVEYFRASTKSIDTNDFQHEAKGHDLQVDVDVKKKDNDDNKTAEPNVDSDLKTNDTDSEVNKDNGIGAGHPDPKEGGSAGFEDVERKSDINNENLQIKDDVEGDIQTNENSDIKFLERIRSVVEDDAGSANKENGETVDAKIENLEIDGSAKHNKKLSESKSLADKMEDISVSIKSLEIKGLQHEADDVESAVDMTKKDYDRNEGAGLNVESDIKTSNTDMETKRNGDITVGQTSSGGEGDAGFEDVERKVDIHDENLQIKQEGKKKSNDIEIEVKIKEDGDISAVQSHSGKDEAINMDLKADAKQKEIGSDKRETDINSEAVKINVNKEMKSKSTVNVGSLREDENAELVKENDVNDEIVDEQNRKVDEGKYIQGTLKKKDIQESNIEEVIELEGRKALSASIVQTTKIDIDEIANQPQQTVSINIPNVETAKIPEQLNRHEQQNAPATDIDESLRRDFNKYLEKTINDAESLKILKTEVMEPENDQKRVAESRTDRRKIEESADIGGSKIEITEEDIKSSSHLKEIPSKVSELIIEDTSKNSDNTKIVIYRDAPNSGIAETTLRHIEDDSGSAEDGKPNVEVIKEVKTDSLKNEAKENNGSEAKSQLISNWKVEDDSHVKEKKYDDAKYIDSSKENTAQQCADDKINESNVKNLLDSKPDFYRSDTVVEPLLVKKNVPHLSDDTTDSNNNTSKEETPLEEGIRAAVSQIVKPIDVESLLKTLPEVPTHDLPPTEDDLSSFGSTDSVVTVIMKPKQEIAPRTLPSRTFSTSALEDRVELLDQVQNSLLDQLSGKSKFDIDQLRKELHDATLYKEESPPDAEVLEYVYDFDPEDDPEYERVARTPLRELPDIAEEDDVPETSGGLTNEIVISNDSIEIGKEHQRLLHTGELHDSVLVANGQSLWAGSESRNRLKHTSEFHDTVVVPLPSGADVKITNASKTAVTEATGAKQDRNESGGTEHDRRDSGNQTSDQQPPAGAEAVTSRDVGGAAQAALKDAAPAGPESTRPAQSPARTVNEAMESENNNNKRNNAIATNVPERNMEAQAATKIQAGFRGYQVRKQLKAKNTALDQKRQLRKRTSRDNLKNPDLEEKSAVKIQAGVRGFLVRRRQKKQASNSSASA